MRKHVLSVLAILTAGTGLAIGQNPNSPYAAAQLQQPAATATVSDASAAPQVPCQGDCGRSRGPSGWFGVDYALLFPSRQNIPQLLNDAAGAPLVGPGFGPDIAHGVRIDTGLWLREGETAMEGIFGTMIRSYATANFATGVVPTVGIGPVPVVNFGIQSWTQYSFGEGNTLLHVAGDGPTKVFALAGTRYSVLEEQIQMTYTAAGANFLDIFHTRDQFFGGQVGATVVHCMGRLTLDATGKVGLGLNYTSQWILGSNAAGVPFQLFTGRSNIGYYESSYFGVQPEANIHASYRVTERIGVNIGYAFMCSINNWRAGDQITLANDGGVTQPTVGPPVRSVYFLHGLTAGVTFRY